MPSECPGIRQDAVCPRCGLRGDGRHPSAEQCIDSLRDYIARLQFRVERRSHESKPSHRGGRRERRDTRWVVLDSERLTLTEAARRLGLTASSLHFRILRRVDDPDYGEVDVRAIGADKARR